MRNSFLVPVLIAFIWIPCSALALNDNKNWGPPAHYSLYEIHQRIHIYVFNAMLPYSTAIQTLILCNPAQPLCSHSRVISIDATCKSLLFILSNASQCCLACLAVSLWLSRPRPPYGVKVLKADHNAFCPLCDMPWQHFILIPAAHKIKPQIHDDHHQAKM